MEASFWHEKWELGQIGFHNNEVHPLLAKHIDKLQLKKGASLFLPLCGKTVDFAYLMKLGYQVIGVELSEIAIQDLFQALKLTPTISAVGELTLYQAKGIDVFVGDFFKLTAEILNTTSGKIDAVYDRASLIALPLDTRQRYTKHLIEITNTSPQLLICLEYDQTKMDGPPFSISPSEVANHYETVFSLNCVERDEISGGLKGKFEGYESVWVLQTL